MPGGQLSQWDGPLWRPKYAVFSEKLTNQPLRACAGGAAIRTGAPQSFGRRAVVFLILFYKSALSPLLPSCCKFYPTCSIYAKEAVERHGVARGLLLALKRVLRCRPFASGGHDPVPDA